MNYWIALFTIDTWAAFRSSAVKSARFPEHRLRLAQKIESGDLLLFYVTGFSRFVGFGYVDSPAVVSHSQFGASGPKFPVLIGVRDTVELGPEFGLPIHDLLPDLSLTKDNNYNGWRFLVRGSPTRWSNADGSFVVKKIREEQSSPRMRPLEKYRRPVVKRRNPFS